MKYFLHDSNAFNDEKITQLFIEYGYEGLGLFYTILERLALQEKPVLTSVLKHQLKVGKKLNKCWNFMESIELISSNNGETFNKQLLNFSEKYKIKKQKNAERISQWRKNQEDSENVTRSESVRNTPKVKESKVNRSKENKDGVVFPFDSIKFKEQWQFWKDFKKDEFKFNYKSVQSEQAALKQLSKLSKNDELTAIEIIHQSFANGWKGFFELKNNNNGQPNNQDREQYERLMSDLDRESNSQQEFK